MLDRARVLGAALRVAYLISASMPGVLPQTPMMVERGTPGAAASRATSRRSPASACSSRLRQLARLVGREPVVLTG